MCACVYVLSCGRQGGHLNFALEKATALAAMEATQRRINMYGLTPAAFWASARFELDGDAWKRVTGTLRAEKRRQRLEAEALGRVRWAMGVVAAFGGHWPASFAGRAAKAAAEGVAREWWVRSGSACAVALALILYSIQISRPNLQGALFLPAAQYLLSQLHAFTDCRTVPRRRAHRDAPHE